MDGARPAIIDIAAKFAAGAPRRPLESLLGTAVNDQQPAAATTEEKALQSALAVVANRRARMDKAAEDVTDARKWVDNPTEYQDQADL